MSLSLSERCDCVMQSEIRMMSIECARHGGINLSQGVCDTPVPAVVREGASDAIEAGRNTYTHYAGIASLRAAIAMKHRRLYGMEIDAHHEIIVSAGATGAMYSVFQALLNPGDEVIVFEPFYGYHVSTLHACGARPVFVTLQQPDWSFEPLDLERVVTARTKAIIVNTPGNPSGKVFSREELGMIAAFARAHDLFVITDEIYEHFLYDGAEHLSPAMLDGMRERTVIVSGFSKTFSVTGWRIGYAICDRKWASSVGYFNDLFYVCAPAPLQEGVARGLRDLGEGYYRGLSEEYGAKRDRFCKVLEGIGLTPCVPRGAYYVLADTSRLPGKTSREKAMHILLTSGVASVPGSAFYHDRGGDNFVRFCFAKEDAVLNEACRRLVKLA